MSYVPVIGLEIHAQLLTETKLFCGCSTAFGSQPNSQTCPVCMGLPGALPVVNKKAVEFAIKMILAVGGTVNLCSEFARKNYFYPDLPKGYQISQFDKPIGTGGIINLESGSVKIKRIHLEEDAGKLFHPDNGEDFSRIDFNRCGTPLIEIVTEPEIVSPEAAHEFLTKIRQLVRYLKICSGDMEKGALRCDANVSIRLEGETKLGTRTELKNLNSIKAVQRALQFEIERQSECLNAGQPVVQETLLWNENSRQTEVMRGKEDADDYRYFPEPDLPPLKFDGLWLKEIHDSIPELPDSRKKRFESAYNLSKYEANILTADDELSQYFEQVVKTGSSSHDASNWVINNVLQAIREQSLEVTELPVTPKSLAELIAKINNGTISVKIAKEIFKQMLDTGQSASFFIEKKGLTQISDTEELGKIVDLVLDGNQEQLDKYRRGKTGLFDFFVGQIMKETNGLANPEIVNSLLRERLK